MAMEFKGKGADIALGPVAGPLGRSGYGGRNWYAIRLCLYRDYADSFIGKASHLIPTSLVSFLPKPSKA
jgi:hypothetical protein